MKWIRRSYRLLFLLVLLCVGLLVQLLIQPWLGQGARRTLIRWWSRALMMACGVRVVEVLHPGCGCDASGEAAAEEGAVFCRASDVAAQKTDAEEPSSRLSISDQNGAIDQGNELAMPMAARQQDQGGLPGSLATLAPGRMLVANHVSWLDIFAINALAPSAFVAKAEIRRWPVVGWLVAMAGTIFIERGRRQAITAINQQLHERLITGYPVAFFPEATTHAGPDLKPFHGNLLTPAIGEGGEIIPIGLQYTYPDGSAGEAAWFVGDTTFMQSLWAVVGAPRLIASVHVLPPISAAGWRRQALADELRGRIGGVLMRRADTPH
ncbi:MAG: lysophospholipid acyltransferase family protein [Lautropia sp.]|nr:lysophospholipid acyltransferase family protein [Lautropia sp.]